MLVPPHHPPPVQPGLGAMGSHPCPQETLGDSHPPFRDTRLPRLHYLVVERILGVHGEEHSVEPGRGPSCVLSPTVPAPHILGLAWEAPEDSHMASLQKVPSGLRVGARERGACPFLHQYQVRGIGLLWLHRGEARGEQAAAHTSSQPPQAEFGHLRITTNPITYASVTENNLCSRDIPLKRSWKVATI